MISRLNTCKNGIGVGVMVGTGLGVNVSQGVTVLTGICTREGVPTGLQLLNNVKLRRRIAENFFMNSSLCQLQRYPLTKRQWTKLEIPLRFFITESLILIQPHDLLGFDGESNVQSFEEFQDAYDGL